MKQRTFWRRVGQLSNDDNKFWCNVFVFISVSFEMSPTNSTIFQSNSTCFMSIKGTRIAYIIRCLLTDQSVSSYRVWLVLDEPNKTWLYLNRHRHTVWFGVNSGLRRNCMHVRTTCWKYIYVDWFVSDVYFWTHAKISTPAFVLPPNVNSK